MALRSILNAKEDRRLGKEKTWESVDIPFLLLLLLLLGVGLVML